MRRSLVVAVARNGVIGRDNQLPWRLPADLAFFKRVTMGHPVIMGRRTHQSIGRLLPGRQNIVVTRDAGFQSPGAIVVHSLADAYRAAEDAEEVFVIGGTSIFEAALRDAERIYLTEIDAEIEGDTYFPAIDRSDWLDKELERHTRDDRHAYAFRILQLDRRRPASP